MVREKDAGQQPSPLYSAVDFYLLRAPVLPVHVFSELAATSNGIVTQSNGVTDSALATIRRQYHDALQALAVQPLVEQALTTASNSIVEGIARIRGGEVSRRTERTYSRLSRYLIRMSTRPTPFGLFAGVTMGTFADQTTVTLGNPAVQQIRTRPDMNWLLSVIQHVEQTQELVSQLHLVVNRAAYFMGERVVLPYADVYGQGDDRIIDVRVTPVVRYVLECTRHPIHYRELRVRLLEKFPQATPEQVDQILQQLWENRFLISDLRPPLIGTNPAYYVAERLSTLPGAQQASTVLKGVLQKAAKVDQAGVGGSVQLIHDLTQQQEQLVPESKHVPFQIDTALQVESPYLNTCIGEAAAQAGETLLRLSRFPHGLPNLEEYRSAFVERYGLEAEVPLLDLLSPEAGLDAPPTYLYPPRTYKFSHFRSPPDYRQRDALLCELVVQAVNNHNLEIELTEALLQQIAQWSLQADAPAPSSLEIYMQIHASSRKALDQGDWRAVISPGCGSPGGGRTFSRFFDILGTESLEKLRNFTRYEESLTPEAIFAELSYLPTRARAANVTVRPALHDYEIVINTTPSVPPEKVIHLDDLVVGVRNNHFYLRSLRIGKEVIVCQSHMLNPMSAPNICRFLLEIALDSRPVLSPLDWGVASTAPFLPRVVQGKVVLSPAQWNLKASTIKPVGTGSEEACWFNGLQQWRTQWRVPRYVSIVEVDNYLLLDLEHPLIAAELHTELSKLREFDTIKIQEMLPDFDHLWLRDSKGALYVAEVVVPLLRTPAQEASAHRETRHTYPPRFVSKEERSMLPGSAWTYLKLYAASRQHDSLIAGPLRELVQQLQEQGLMDRWFFVRYADPEPHLRLRLHAARAEETQVCASLLTTALAWGRRLAERGLLKRVCADVYEREVERYGGPQALESLEQVFMINSTVISNLIAAQYTGQIRIDPVAVAVFSLDQFFTAWGLNFAERFQHLKSRAEKYHSRKAFREQRKLLCELLAPWSQVPDAPLMMQREQLLSLLAAQEEPLRVLSTQLRLLAARGELWQPEEHILESLAHMHVNRLLGIDRDQECKVYAFWRHTLESIRLRPKLDFVQDD